MSAAWGHAALKLAVKKPFIRLFWLIASLLFSLALFAQDAPKAGRLVDLSCGSLTMRGSHLLVVHSVGCLANQSRRGKLAMIVNNSLAVVRLSDEQEVTARKWRNDLSAGEVYITLDSAGHVHRSLLPEAK